MWGSQVVHNNNITDYIMVHYWVKYVLYSIMCFTNSRTGQCCPVVELVKHSTAQPPHQAATVLNIVSHCIGTSRCCTLHNTTRHWYGISCSVMHDIMFCYFYHPHSGRLSITEHNILVSYIWYRYTEIHDLEMNLWIFYTKTENLYHNHIWYIQIIWEGLLDIIFQNGDIICHYLHHILRYSSIPTE